MEFLSIMFGYPDDFFPLRQFFLAIKREEYIHTQRVWHEFSTATSLYTIQGTEIAGQELNLHIYRGATR